MPISSHLFLVPIIQNWLNQFVKDLDINNVKTFYRKNIIMFFRLEGDDEKFFVVRKKRSKEWHNYSVDIPLAQLAWVQMPTAKLFAPFLMDLTCSWQRKTAVAVGTSFSYFHRPYLWSLLSTYLVDQHEMDTWWKQMNTSQIAFWYTSARQFTSILPLQFSDKTFADRNAVQFLSLPYLRINK